MKVFKFGGASVKDAEGVRNLARILRLFDADQIVVVISAMGKTTNALESLLSKVISKKDFESDFLSLKAYHLNICSHIFKGEEKVDQKLEVLFNQLQEHLLKVDQVAYDFHYDQVVSFGELLSTTIVQAFLRQEGFDSKWVDVRDYIKTDSQFRSARVNVAQTERIIAGLEKETTQFIITQGFIGSNEKGQTTTLGREGSDYSAALFAYSLKTEEVAIWKDVDGVFNADPHLFKSPVLIDQLSYKEAVELAFYGASIIHPKTIQPLSERNIQLKVKSFFHPNKAGTLVAKTVKRQGNPSVIIVKKQQLLLSLVPRDLSFMDVPHMGRAFEIIAQHRHHINLIQNSAVSFSVCLDSNVHHFYELIGELQKHFMVRYNSNLVLVTIRNYKNPLVDKIYDSIQLKMEQRNRSTYQILVDESEFSAALLPLIDSEHY
jgi:aspartate kinase